VASNDPEYGNAEGVLDKLVPGAIGAMQGALRVAS
jgi:hypothetical protein